MGKLIWFWSLTCVLSLHCGKPAAQMTETAASHTSENGIPNFHKVNTKLYRSGDVTEDDFGALASLHIKTDLSLEDEKGHKDVSEESGAEDHNMTFVWQPWSPSAKPTIQEINKALAVITNPAKQPVLVHCKHGSDRTGIIVAAYRIKFDHWTKEQAVAEMRQYGHYEGLYFWDDVLDEL